MSRRSSARLPLPVTAPRISLETPFWEALKATAAEEGVAVANLIARIDGSRGRQRPLQRSAASGSSTIIAKARALAGLRGALQALPRRCRSWLRAAGATGTGTGVCSNCRRWRSASLASACLVELSRRSNSSTSRSIRARQLALDASEEMRGSRPPSDPMGAIGHSHVGNAGLSRVLGRPQDPSRHSESG